MKRLVIAYGPAVLWLAFVLFLGGQTGLQGPQTSLPLDKLAHFFMYGVLGALAARGWWRAGRRPARVWLIVAALLFAAADELHQRSVVGRSADVVDWIADGTGLLLAFTLVSLWFARARERRTPKGRRRES